MSTKRYLIYNHTEHNLETDHLEYETKAKIMSIERNEIALERSVFKHYLDNIKPKSKTIVNRKVEDYINYSPY